MNRLLTAAQMRALERDAIKWGGLSGLELMERAGRGVVEAVFGRWPDLACAPHRAAVLCGPGNNGGDGYVVARLLRERGWEVCLWQYGDPARLPPDARASHDRWLAAGGEPRALERFVSDQLRPDLVVDALFGTGLSRRLDALTAEVLGRVGIMRARVPDPARVVAVDMPSGYCADSGRRLFDRADDGADSVSCPLERRTGADLTVTFEFLRRGHRLDEGAIASGRVEVRPLGLRTDLGEALRRCPTPVAGEVAPALRALGKRTSAHKYDHGHALVLSGGPGRTGAARLAARAALRIGAGLVTLGVPPAAQQEVACQITALMLRRVEGGAALRALLEDRRFNALCLGPGLGTGPAQAEVLAEALRAGRPTVLDADALSLLAGRAEPFAALHEDCVLTPHGGEFRRLFPDLHERLHERPGKGPAFSRMDAACAAAERAGCTVLLKGPDTVIAAPGHAPLVHCAQGGRAAPWLATAGAGDVLAGLIAGLMARGFAPFEAAGTGAWLHAECARRFGPGLIAEDLPEALPGVLRALGA